MKKIINGFTVPILEATLENYYELNPMLETNIINLFNTITEKRVLSYEWNNFILTDQSPLLGYSSFNSGTLTEDVKFNSFFNTISPLITDFFNQLEFEDDWNFINAWASVYPTNAWVPSHNHGTSHWSGVYYVNAPLDCGNLFLTDPKEYALSNEPENFRWRGNQPMQILVNSGKLVLFPGYLKHETSPNLSETNRIIISFNINCK